MAGFHYLLQVLTVAKSVCTASCAKPVGRQTLNARGQSEQAAFLRVCGQMCVAHREAGRGDKQNIQIRPGKTATGRPSAGQLYLTLDLALGRDDCDRATCDAAIPQPPKGVEGRTIRNTR